VFRQDELTKGCDECDIFLTKRSQTLITQILHYGKVARLAAPKKFTIKKSKGLKMMVFDFDDSGDDYARSFSEDEDQGARPLLDLK
jgi:hypothetical protein